MSEYCLYRIKGHGKACGIIVNDKGDCLRYINGYNEIITIAIKDYSGNEKLVELSNEDIIGLASRLSIDVEEILRLRELIKN